MARLFFIFLISFFCQIFLFEPTNLHADTFKLTSISVEGNSRISTDAISNYSKLGEKEGKWIEYDEDGKELLINIYE